MSAMTAEEGPSPSATPATAVAGRMRAVALTPLLANSAVALHLDAQFRCAVSDLLDLPELDSSRQRTHHFDVSEFDHLLWVAQRAHQLSRFLRADSRVCARAGLLHDLGAHWFDTWAPCELAERLAEPPSVRHAIRAHTLVPVVPRTREAWIVIAADLITSAQECRFVFRRARDRAGHRLRDRLRRA